MTLVQVIGVEIEAERAQDANAADAENNLLFEPVDLVAPIEEMRQRAILFVILVQLGVEKQDRDLLTMRTGVNVKPGTDPYRLLLDLDGDHGSEWRAPAFGFPPVRPLNLSPVAGDLLTEIAGAA